MDVETEYPVGTLVVVTSGDYMSERKTVTGYGDRTGLFGLLVLDDVHYIAPAFVKIVGKVSEETSESTEYMIRATTDGELSFNQAVSGDLEYVRRTFDLIDPTPGWTLSIVQRTVTTTTRTVEEIV